MADDSREVRRMLKRYRRFVKPYCEEASYPPTHNEIFEDILQLAQYKLSSYVSPIDPRTKNEPWRKQTRWRVKWLTKRACTLRSQRRNEQDWRVNLESHVLHRFLVEVAW